MPLLRPSPRTEPDARPENSAESVFSRFFRPFCKNMRIVRVPVIPHLHPAHGGINSGAACRDFSGTAFYFSKKAVY